MAANAAARELTAALSEQHRQHAVSRLAERLGERIRAGMAAGDFAGTAQEVDREILAAAPRLRMRPWELTLAVGREWDRLGIVRVHAGAGPMGDGFQ